jgi:hypothetical protein
MASCDVTCIPTFMNIGQLAQKLKGGYADKHTHTDNMMIA